VLNTAFGEETFAVDTHIFRVGNRTGLAPGKTSLEVELKLDNRHAAAVPPRRAPLADPARPLHLQGAQAGMLALPGRRPLPLQAEDAAAERAQPSALEPAPRPSAAHIATGPTAPRASADRSRARPSRLP
jgi:endonuclease-3